MEEVVVVEEEVVEVQRHYDGGQVCVGLVLISYNIILTVGGW